MATTATAVATFQDQARGHSSNNNNRRSINSIMCSSSSSSNSSSCGSSNNNNNSRYIQCKDNTRSCHRMLWFPILRIDEEQEEVKEWEL